jgi:hypothetical protein
MAEQQHVHPEERDVSPRAMMLFAGGFILFIAVTLGVLELLFGTTAHWPSNGKAERGNDVSPALQRTPAQDLARHRAEMEKSLHTLAWVDRKAGIARIPIEDAMRIIAAHGLPEWGAATPAQQGECGVLTANVPRTPQAAKCATPDTGKQGAR